MAQQAVRSGGAGNQQGMVIPPGAQESNHNLYTDHPDPEENKCPHLACHSSNPPMSSHITIPRTLSACLSSWLFRGMRIPSLAPELETGGATTQGDTGGGTQGDTAAQPDISALSAWSPRSF